MTKALAAVLVLAIIVGAIGWAAYLWESRAVATLQLQLRGYEQAITACHENIKTVSAALKEQNEALERMAEKAEALQERVDSEVARARQAKAKAEAAEERAKDRDELAERLMRMPSCEACTEAWQWLSEVDDDE